jgi:hypothetical protein
MEGTASDEYERAHPGVIICQVEGIWRAWMPSDRGGDEYHGHTEAELLAKLPS